MSAVRLLILFLTVCLFSCKAPKDLVFQDVENFRIQQFGKEPSVALMDVRLYNPNLYSLILKNGKADVFLGGTHLGQVAMKGKYTATKLDTVSFPVTIAVNINLNEAGPESLLSLMRGELNVKIKGSIKAGRHGLLIKVPIFFEGTQNISLTN